MVLIKNLHFSATILPSYSLLVLSLLSSVKSLPFSVKSYTNSGKDCDSEESVPGVPCYEYEIDDDDDGGRLRKGAIIGIVVGVAALAIAIPLFYCFCCGCLCFKKHWRSRTSQRVLSATIRSQQRQSQHSTEPQPTSISRNEKPSMQQTMTLPHPNTITGHFQPRIMNNYSSPSDPNQYPPSEDNSAYWGGYSESMGAGENIYSEPEHYATAPEYLDNRQAAVIDGAFYPYPGFNQPPPPYPMEGYENEGFASSEVLPQPMETKNRNEQVLNPYLTEL